MASKVNTKFVAMLVAALVLVGGAVVGTAYFILFKSASQLQALAKSKVDAGDFVAADKFLSKAVAKERTNSAYMREWIDVMTKLELKTQTEFENKYRTNYIPAKRQLAVLLREDVAAHKDYLENVWDQMTSGAMSRRAADEMIKQTNDALRFFDKKPAGPWETLKRYRGMSLVRAMLDNAEMKEEERKQAREDLEAALAADPKDSDVAVALENWHFAQSIALRNKALEDEAKVELAAGRDVIEKFLAANPNDPKALLVQVRWLLNDAQKAIGDALTPEAKTSAFKRANEVAKPKLDAVAAVVEAAPIDRAGLEVVSILKTYETMLDPGANNARALKILQAQSGAYPDDADLLYALGRTYQDRNEFDKAIETYEKMIAIPQKKLGLPGLRQFTLRAEGAFRQTMAACALWDRTDPATDEGKKKRTELLTKAKDYRANLIKFEPEDSPRGRLATAAVKYREGDASAAQAMIVAYENANKEPDAEALWLSAQIANTLGQPGVARTKLQQLLSINGNDAKAVFMLASIEARLKNFEVAESLADALLKADPNNDLTKQLLTEIRMQKGDVSVGDEITKALNQAQKFSDAGDLANMNKVLDETFDKNPKDIRIAFANTLAKYRAKNYEAAVAIARRALAADPNNEQLKQLVLIAGEKDPVKGAILAIDASPAAPLDKLLQKIDVYRNNPGDYEKEIRALIDEAVKIAGDDPRVIEFRFIAAITGQNFDEGRKITDTATTKNIDNIGGASFRARLMDSESEALRKSGKVTEADAKLADAVATLQQASSQAGFGQPAWRMLGNLQFRSGRYTDAINSYKAGLAIDPANVQMIEEYIAAMVNVPGETMMEQALQFARESDKYARGSGRFRNMLLNLEARFGDVQVAIREREKMKNTATDNRDNKVALAALYIDDKQFDKARALIDDVRAERDDIETVQLAARYWAAAGDAAKAESTVREYASKIDPSKSETDRANKTQAMLSLVRQAVTAADLAKVEAVVEEIRKFQDPKTLPADRTLGDMYMSMEKWQPALVAIKRVLDGKADEPDQTYAKRYIECAIRAGKVDEAQAMIKSMGSYGESNPIVQLLLADSMISAASASRAKGDEAKAKQLEGQAGGVLDKAVTNFPGSAEVYLKRAQFTLQRNGPVNDALADASKALQIRPGYPQALRVRAQINARGGREEEAIKDMREALRTDIYADEQRQQLMARLIADGRAIEANEVANEAISRRPNDVRLILGFATLFSNLSDTERAMPFVDAAVKKSDEDFVVLQALDFYLNVLPANNAIGLEKAEKLLDRVKAKIDGNSALLAGRSLVLARRGKPLEARRDAAASFKLIPADDLRRTLNWFGQVRRVFKPADIELLFAGLERENFRNEWIQYFRSQQLMLAKEGEAKGVETLTKLLATKDENLLLQVYRTLAPYYYTNGDYKKAVEIWVVAIERFPKDWEMRNNLAFTYAKFLNEPKKAVEQAKQAVSILEANSETNADVYDTLGYCLTINGDYAAAKTAFETALQQATSRATAVTILTHHTQMLIKSGQKDQAKSKYLQAQEFLNKMAPPQNSAEQIKQAREELEALKADAGV
ncbi:MAG: tetratricopeptide repeat protein [Planctomycetota bacterium]|nr:tetratricopeptide repeat protein [Planctomycetota bacterium]